MVLAEKTQGAIVATDALQWLRRQVNEIKILIFATKILFRGLHFIVRFFQCIVEENERTENLSPHLKTAYSETLEMYHGWMGTQLFSVPRPTEKKQPIWCRFCCRWFANLRRRARISSINSRWRNITERSMSWGICRILRCSCRLVWTNWWSFTGFIIWRGTIGPDKQFYLCRDKAYHGIWLF